MDFLFLLVGLLIGVFVGWLFAKLKINKSELTTNRVTELANSLTEKQIALEVACEKNKQYEKNINDLKFENESQNEKIIKLNSDLASKNSDFQNLNERLDSQNKEVEGLQKKFVESFDNLANKILEEKSNKFTQQNKENIDQILKPLNEKLKDFQQTVVTTYEKNLKDRTDLQAEVKKLYELNARISQEATNLTKALKGDVKKQGNWGEMVLERILENSGLEKDREYKIQKSFNHEEGGRYQPDVVVYLPDNKHIIIDAKVSLLAYENYVSAETDEQRGVFVKEHLNSIKRHIKGLSDKQYFKLEGLNTPEYVLMFMPIESSFGIAVKEDNELFNEAWNYKIVIVSPSTLIATLMTVASIWNQENQTKNAIEIARQSGNLYDKFEGLMKDLLQLGRRIEDSHKLYKSSMNKLVDGSGNLISRVENLKALGAKASKSLPTELIERSKE